MVVIKQKEDIPLKKLTALEVESPLYSYFNFTRNVIVPNYYIQCGYECDLVIMSKAGYVTEVEIKVSKSDLVADLKKKHGHESRKIKYLYFAMPDYLEGCIELIPERAGVLLIDQRGMVSLVRSPIENKCCCKLNENERDDLLRCGVMRIAGLKMDLERAR